MHEQQLTSGLLRNIAPMMATFCNTWNMHCIKWICSSPPFGSMYRINTRDKDESEHFTFSKFYAIAHYSFACMEPTTEMKAAYKWIVKEHFPRIESMPISKSRLSGIQHARQMQWRWRLGPVYFAGVQLVLS